MSEKGIINRWAKEKIEGATPQASTVFTYTGMLTPVEIGLSKYVLPSGEVVFEEIQVIALIPMSRPEFYLALKDGEGEWLPESRWRKSDFWGLISHGAGNFDAPGDFEEG